MPAKKKIPKGLVKRAYYKVPKGPKHFYVIGDDESRKRAKKLAIKNLGPGYKGGRIPRFYE